MAANAMEVRAKPMASKRKRDKAEVDNGEIVTAPIEKISSPGAQNYQIVNTITYICGLDTIRYFSVISCCERI